MYSYEESYRKKSPADHLLVFVGVAVVGTFYFLWKKAQPVITLYELVTLHVTRLRRRRGDRKGRTS